MDDLHFKPSIKEQRKEVISKCLSPYFGPILQAGDCDSVALVGEGMLPPAFPYSVFSLPHLTSLHLDNNYLGRKKHPLPQVLDASVSVKPPSPKASFFELLASHLTLLNTLTLSNNHIHSFPQPLCTLTHLSFLVLNKNFIPSLPPEIGNLTALETLSLSHNDITSLPAEMEKLKKLKSFNISNNLLKSVPAALASLTQLERLELHDNPFEAPYDALNETQDTQVLLLPLPPFHPTTPYTPLSPNTLDNPQVVEQELAV